MRIEGVLHREDVDAVTAVGFGSVQRAVACAHATTPREARVEPGPGSMENASTGAGWPLRRSLSCGDEVSYRPDRDTGDGEEGHADDGA